jgi:hypothetical protein
LRFVYGELRKLAAARLAHEKPREILQATALVHEAYVRPVDTEKVQVWASRGHFFAAAAEAKWRVDSFEGGSSVAHAGCIAIPYFFSRNLVNCGGSH